VRIIEHEAGGLMGKLGYPRMTRTGPLPYRPAGVVAHACLRSAYGFARRMADRIDWRLKRLLRRM
jgi:hypothetical protein